MRTEHPERKGPRCVAYQTADDDLVVCEATNPAGWIRADTTVPLEDAPQERRDARA